MKQIIFLLTVLPFLSQASYKAGQCDQWCKDFPELFYEGGEWNEKENRCRCYHDYDRQFMDSLMRIPFTIKKPQAESSSSI